MQHPHLEIDCLHSRIVLCVTHKYFHKRASRVPWQRSKFSQPVTGCVLYFHLRFCSLFSQLVRQMQHGFPSQPGRRPPVYFVALTFQVNQPETFRCPSPTFTMPSTSATSPSAVKQSRSC